MVLYVRCLLRKFQYCFGVLREYSVVDCFAFIIVFSGESVCLLEIKKY